MNRLVVSTECPTCAAPLDFTEGSNAIQCGHCHSQLLVTGRKRVLSYYIAPTVDARAATLSVASAQREAGQRCRIGAVGLYFIPYYRLTGHDLRWEKPEALPPPPPDPDDRESFGIRSLLFGTRHREGDEAAGNDLALHEGYIEKNFIACQLPEPILYSLGVRPTVLRLLLFQAAAVRALGKVASTDLSPDAALERGMKVAADQPILQRRVIGRLLSLVYFPYWMVEVERGATTLLGVVDAVSGAVVKADASLALYEALNREAGAEPATAGFRPLVCPNCGADFPVRPDDVVFFCSACESAWEIEGEELSAVEYQVGRVPSGVGAAALHYLPFWLLETERSGQDHRRLFLPAFRYRRLKILVDLARGMTLKQPPLGGREFVQPNRNGCHYDQDDALKLAELTYPGLAPMPRQAIQQLEGEPLHVCSSLLTWLPFQLRGNELVDCNTGRALTQQLLL